jgi:hypothetical protein
MYEDQSDTDDCDRHLGARDLGRGRCREDKYDLRVPGGLAFSEFRGYEDWAVIAIDHTEDLMKVIVGNPVAMDAFRAGIPGNGKPFPDGSKMAKVEWRPKRSPDAPYDINVPGTGYDLDFMIKDAKRSRRSEQYPNWRSPCQEHSLRARTERAALFAEPAPH